MIQLQELSSTFILSIIDFMRFRTQSLHYWKKIKEKGTVIKKDIMY